MSHDGVTKLYQNALNTIPFHYQRQLASESIRNRLLMVPTGAGKTAAAVLSWVHQIEVAPEATPLRLIYCLPMRSLVEQTRSSVESWFERLQLAIPVYTLMGGEVDEDWEWEPDKHSVLVGTQDMLLSRVLNRGYAMGRYRWPLHFALLNNDCLWVIDEVQLFGSGLATSTQLQAFREQFKTFGPTATWWMSATASPGWLETIDFKKTVCDLKVTELTSDSEDIDPTKSPELSKRYKASKPVSPVAGISGEEIGKLHQPGKLTVVVMNTIKRAKELFVGLLKPEVGKKRSPASVVQPELLLLHSRFRQPDREVNYRKLIAADKLLRGQDTGGGAASTFGEKLEALRDRGMICIATQVIEAGVDISATTLVTELAPWASMVQRFGRCNRFGVQDAQIYWRDLKKKDEASPYELSDLNEARERLQRLPNANGSPEAIQTFGSPTLHEPARVIRRHDLIGLFSTEADLAGGYTDVSMFVRDLDRETDVYIFWRDFDKRPPEKIRVRADEICTVPVIELKDLIQNAWAWEWNGELRRWETRRGRDIRPGMTLLLSCSTGGYCAELGWTGDPNDKPAPLHTEREEGEEAQSQLSDPESETAWVPLADHLKHAEDQFQPGRGFSDGEQQASRLALSWHDVGKAHLRWQNAIPHPMTGGPWAKFPRTPKSFRPQLRHEAASALAAWKRWVNDDEGWTALSVYLIATHHGKVRTVLRSRIRSKAGGGDVFGIKSDEELHLPGWLDEPIQLDLSASQFGATGEWVEDKFSMIAPGWVEVVAALLQDEPGILGSAEPQAFGPFRLAMLEACITIADIRASREEDERQ